MYLNIVILPLLGSLVAGFFWTFPWWTWFWFNNYFLCWSNFFLSEGGRWALLYLRQGFLAQHVVAPPQQHQAMPTADGVFRQAKVPR